MNYKGVKDKIFTCKNCQAEFKFKGHSQLNKFCNVKCAGEFKNKKWYKENETRFLNGTLNSRSAIKRFIVLRDGSKCSICEQQPEHNGKPLVMILDHIDGDASNNMPDNFRLVCPNCDSQLPTYKAKNTGKGRATRGMKWNSRL